MSVIGPFPTYRPDDLINPPDIAWWKINEGSGTQIFDSSGNGYTGSFVNGGASNISWVSGPGTAQAIHAVVNDYVDCGTGPTRTAGPFTYTYWLKLDTFNSGAHQAIIGNDTTAGVEIRMNDGPLSLLSQNILQVGVASQGISSSGTWWFIAVSYDASGNYAFYLQGILTDGANNLTTFAAGKTLLLSSPPAGDAINPGGSLSDVRIYGRVLTASEVLSLYNAGAV